MTNPKTLHLDVGAVPKHHHTWGGLVLKSIVALALIAGLALLFHFVFEPEMPVLEQFLHRIGPWAPVVFIAIFLVGTAVFLPESLIAIAAGAIFGIWMGLIWVVVAGTLTAIIIFVVGRHFLQSRIERILAQHPKIQAIDTAASSAGFKLMFLLRLSPLNYSLLCWLLAVSKAKFLPYLFACIGMFPGNFSTVYAGYAARHAANLAHRVHEHGGHLPPGDSLIHEITLFGGLAAAILASLFVSKIAMRAIRQAAAKPPGGETQSA